VRIAVGADHAGFALKQEVAASLRKQGHEVVDVGTDSTAPVDYPDFAEKVSLAVRDGQAERAVLICGSGVGASVAANKIKGIRAAICHDVYSAHQGVEHDDMNVLCLGSRIVGAAVAEEATLAFVAATFNTTEPRYARRLEKVREMERRQRKQDLVLSGGDAAPEAPKPIIRGPKIGRNDPCPCGSGKKYKKCCGLKAN